MNTNQKISTREMEKLFKVHFPMLCLIAFAIVKDREAAKDIVQDFFISYWHRRSTVVITTSFKSYAIGAVKNLSLLSLEKAKKEKSLLEKLNSPKYEDPEVLESSGPHRKIEALLDQLPESRRRIFISAIINGQSYAEIAEAQGISINTVKTQMKRAYAYLRSEATDSLIPVFIISMLITLFLTQ